MRAPSDVARAAYEVSFDPVVWVVLGSDDHSEMQVVTVSAFNCV